MLFPTFSFAVFFAVVLTVGWALHRDPPRWKLFMLAASYFFYGFWDWRFIGLIVASTLVNHSAGRALHHSRGWGERRRSVLLGVTVAANVGLLGLFKYYDFFARSIAATFGRVGLPEPPLLQLVLPVAISFFTFQALSYVIDIRRDRLDPAPLIDFALFLSFFPHLVAGPIVRASEFLPQLRVKPDPRRVDLSGAAALIGVGLFKKVVISSYLAEAIVDPVFSSPGDHSSLELLIGIYGYAVQIYADFSGYTDIAIGLALLLGIRFPANFDRPYSAVSIQEFWRRWHMTLSNWLRDYLYIPLGGSRASASKRNRNLFLTMLLGGLWHGAAWTFVVWGAYQGAGLILERRWADARSERLATRWRRRMAPVSGLRAGTAEPPPSDLGPNVIDLTDAAMTGASPGGSGTGSALAAPVGARLVTAVRHLVARPDTSGSDPNGSDPNGGHPHGHDDPDELDAEEEPGAAALHRRAERRARWTGRVITFHFVCVGWVFFRSDSLEGAFHLLGRLLYAWGPAPLVTPWVLTVIAGSLAVQFIPRTFTRNVLADLSRLPVVAQATIFGCLLVLIDLLGPAGVAPFIYFRF
ncbi:MAG: MBOAT family O-acyltransferase [Acidimicrobiales bacterium]